MQNANCISYPLSKYSELPLIRPKNSNIQIKLVSHLDNFLDKIKSGQQYGKLKDIYNL